MLQRLILDEDGQSLVEYGLILGIVSVALISVLTVMKENLYNIFTSVAKSLSHASSSVGK